MKKGKRIFGREENTVIDENGEFKQSYKNFSYRYKDTPNFVMLFLEESLSTLYDLPSSCSTVLFHLLKHTKFANDIDSPFMVYTNDSLKRDLIKNSNINSTQTINNALTELCKKEILIRISRGKYQLNPYLFGKGDIQDIYELRMTHIWSSFGHKVEVSSKRAKRLTIELSKFDKEIYYKYLSVENISNITGKDFNVVISENNIEPPPNWWYLLQ